MYPQLIYIVATRATTGTANKK